MRTTKQSKSHSLLRAPFARRGSVYSFFRGEAHITPTISSRRLGIMHMFGGFGPAFFEAYHAVIPRAQPYYEERVLCYELYHHLNHASLFGGVSHCVLASLDGTVKGRNEID